MSKLKQEECLLCLRVPLEKLLFYSRKLYEDDTMALVVANRASKLIYSAYLLDRFEMCGSRPKTIIGSALYISGILEDAKMSQKIVASKLGISSASIMAFNKRFNKILNLGFKSYLRVKKLRESKELDEIRVKKLRESKELDEELNRITTEIVLELAPFGYSREEISSTSRMRLLESLR